MKDPVKPQPSLDKLIEEDQQQQKNFAQDLFKTFADVTRLQGELLKNQNKSRGRYL